MSIPGTSHFALSSIVLVGSLLAGQMGTLYAQTRAEDADEVWANWRQQIVYPQRDPETNGARDCDPSASGLRRALSRHRLNYVGFEDAAHMPARRHPVHTHFAGDCA